MTAPSKAKRTELIPFYSFAEYLTPEQAREKGSVESLKQLYKRARVNRKCCNCENPVWRYADLDMCFPCVTGETDASNDYELRYIP